MHAKEGRQVDDGLSQDDKDMLEMLREQRRQEILQKMQEEKLTNIEPSF